MDPRRPGTRISKTWEGWRVPLANSSSMEDAVHVEIDARRRARARVGHDPLMEDRRGALPG